MPFLSCHTDFVFLCASWWKIQVQVGKCLILQACNSGQSDAIIFLTISSRNKSQERELLGFFNFILNNSRCSSFYQCFRFLFSPNCLLYNICWPSRLMNLHNYWLLQKFVFAFYFKDIVLTTLGTTSMINDYEAGWLSEWYFQFCTRQIANRWVYIKARSKFRFSVHTQPPDRIKRQFLFLSIREASLEGVTAGLFATSVTAIVPTKADVHHPFKWECAVLLLFGETCLQAKKLKINQMFLFVCHGKPNSSPNCFRII